MSVTIYHNPRCSSSRLALETVRAAGIEPTIVEYLQTPPTREKLVELLAAMGMRPRALLRTNEKAYETLKLADPKWTDGEIVGFMVENPILINRPIVVTPKGALLARPGDKVKAFLP
ncbi:arsenate reductase (glutaredoxin) [Kumtagia ephedrae]|uniref:Arsenate reductase n=1 Tax=Kumtagia ephedrae TaxID=2116701 RepID=A0A2P7SJ77_9HYPH|nr:arsenate reductase (glutaredoxin) [Mesorhizobium ephedrae]PSJ62548.1 arsenate reductase (glutaredoxin) [Mesorhizobium ephedrae]